MKYIKVRTRAEMKAERIKKLKAILKEVKLENINCVRCKECGKNILSLKNRDLENCKEHD